MLVKSVLRSLAGLVLVSLSTPLHAAPQAQLGYESKLLYQADLFSFAGGLDVSGNIATFSVDSSVLNLNLATGSVVTVGSLPSPNVGASYVKRAGGLLHVAYAQNFAFPPPCRYGVVNGGGSFQDYGGLDGVYDAAANSEGTLYVAAAPSMVSGAQVFRFDPATTSLVSVINVGGYSGGIAFDDQDRLYVAEQMEGKILRFTPEQLENGNLTAADGEAVVNVFASYICLDQKQQLYAVTDYGNGIAVYHVESGNFHRSVVVDDAFGYGIGWIGWDRIRNALLLVYTDYYTNPASSIHAITFTSSTNGLSGSSPAIRGWIAGYQDYVRPNTNSGGFAADDEFTQVSPGAAIIGKPAEFDPDVGNSHVVSLGNGGRITLLFEDAIANGPGADFAVFENAFDVWGGATHAEFAFVDVATTTNAWARFPVTYFGTNAIPHNAVQSARLADGLAGKHTTEYGTPFDLEWLKNSTNVLNGSVDLNHIVYIRLTDVVGDGSTADQFGHPIYDPYQANTSYLDGFDVRGVGVIHTAGLEVKRSAGAGSLRFYGVSGRMYQLQVSGDGEAWENVNAPFSGTGGVHTISMPVNGDAAALMRIQQEIPFTP